MNLDPSYKTDLEFDIVLDGKTSQKSRSLLYKGYRFLGIVLEEKNVHLIPEEVQLCIFCPLQEEAVS